MDFPTWKEEWNLLVHSKVDETTEVLNLREVVQREARIEVRTRGTLTEV